MENTFNFDDVFEVVTPELEYGLERSVEVRSECERESTDSDKALIDCVNACGYVDLRRISESSGIPADTLVSDLRGRAIYQDPAFFEDRDEWSVWDGWTLSSSYLFGNIPWKYDIAFKMNVKFPGCFDVNLEGLRRLLPARLTPEQIRVSFGANWVPAEYYRDFMMERFDLVVAPKVYYSKELASWKVSGSTASRRPVIRDSYCTSDFPPDRLFKLVELTMNGRTAKSHDPIYRYDGKIEYVFNKERTLENQDKQTKLIRDFESWIYDDEYRRARIPELYYDKFVGYAFSPYNGDFLRLPGLSEKVKLYGYQRDSVARILLSGGNTLLAHDVGAGKTYIMIVAAHELKRMGLSEKTMIVVPNNVLRSAVDAHRLLYHDDEILVVSPKDFTPDRRGKTLDKIRLGDYVCIYIASSSFDLIDLSKRYWEEKKAEKIRRVMTAAALCERKDEKRALEREAEHLKKKLAKYREEAEESIWTPFEELGIKTLFVDEAHNYKNIPIESRCDNIVGMRGKGSRKCGEMLEKCRTVERVLFATGTPITNSISDLYVMMTYLQPEELRFRGIDNFDMWINTFGERETNFETDVDGSGIRPVTRFSSFHNLEELMAIFSTVCDFHYNDPNSEDLPGYDGPVDVVSQKTPAVRQFYDCLVKRTEDIRTHQVSRTEDNLLKVTVEGRNCAVSPWLVDLEAAEIIPESDDYVFGKIRYCADKVYEMYLRYPGTCQLVFSDVGTPKDRYNVYDDLKERLVGMGIPSDKIAFVHDATSDSARAKLFARMNAGDLSVVIGSTQKLGIGVNVQERLVALHHLSVPWRPADMVQREGRIIRRGNTCEKVYIFRYVTEGTFDSFSWQLLESKQRFISSFLAATCPDRDRDDVADTVLDYAQVKALAIGNKLIKTRVETANRMDRAGILARKRRKKLVELRTLIEELPSRIETLTDLRNKAALDAARYKSGRERVGMDERRAFGEELLEALGENVLRGKESFFGWYQGFDIILPANMIKDRPFVYVSAAGGGKYHLEIEGDKPLGCAMRVDKLLEGLPDRVKKLEEQISEAYKEGEDAEKEIEIGNPYQDEVEALAKTLAEIDKKLFEAEENNQ